MFSLSHLITAVVSSLFIYSTSLEARTVTIGSKKFTESVILGEISRIGLEAEGVSARHLAELGGTRILWNALLSGDIDTYPEYTSTIQTELLKRQFTDLNDMREALKEIGIGMGEPLGFNNTYALGMTKARARELRIEKISDLQNHPNIKIGWGDEFRRRNDGWPGLKATYRLPQRLVRGLDHDIAYRALQSGDIDLKDLYSTDAEIQYYDLKVLEDDLQYFPRYEAIFLYRLDTARELPKLGAFLRQLEGRISEDLMITMNRRAKVEKTSSSDIATDFLNQTLNLGLKEEIAGRWERLYVRTVEHLHLVTLSLSIAILLAIPLGVLAAKKPLIGRFIIWGTGGIQTIPSLALLVILIKPLNMLGLTGIGDTPALIALFLYSLLPIVRGTHSGFLQIPLSLRETASVLGLSKKTQLLRIDLPLALPSILSGIKTAAVMNVGFATLGALIGAGGYGQPILAGIRLDDYQLILEGAIPSALMALVVQQVFDTSEKYLVSPGLRK